jgi:hypothetical protein
LDIGGSHGKRPGTKTEKRFGIPETLNIATWNVRSIGNKESELAEEIKTECINTAVISETKNKLKRSKMMGNYTMLYSGVSQVTIQCYSVEFLR